MPQYDHDIRNRLLVARLPAMPQILVKLIELCQTEDAGMGDLAKLIANDPGMTTKCMGLANSSAFHRSSGVKVGLEQALSAMGTDMIKTLVISESVFQTFSSFSHSNSIDLGHFWKHSLTAAVIAREIARAINYPHTDEAYLAGLLHDVGRLALLSAAPQEYAYNFLARDDENLCAIEQRTLEITHSEAGAWLLERWHLDSFMADSVLYHHESATRLQAAHPLIRLVRLAHTLSLDDPDEQDLQSTAALCGLDEAAIGAIREGATRQVQETAKLLGIELSVPSAASAPAAFAPALALPDVAQQKLTEEVRNMALLSELGRSFSQQKSDAELLDFVIRSARILFNIDDAIILLHNHETNVLAGLTLGPQYQRLGDFSIPLGEQAGSPIAAIARAGEPGFIGDDLGVLGVGEEQLLRMFGTECLLCLPLTVGERCLGVLISGIAPWQVAYLQGRQRFLQSFGIQATVALQAAIGERNAAQRQLNQVSQEYLDASRRIVHEVNNPLSIIKNYLGVLGGKLSREQAVGTELTILNEEIDRVSTIIKGLTEPAAPVPEGPTDVNRIVRDVVQLFVGGELPAGVRIAANLPDTPSEIESPSNLVKQILMNLVKNAIEAMPRGGQIDIINNGRVHRDGIVYLELRVRDNGPGIADHVLSHLFTPVRSSKGGENRGIGLSIVHGLVQEMGGLISCRSSHEGTSFDVLLPLPNTATASAAIAQAVAADALARPGAANAAVEAAPRLKAHHGAQ